MLNQALIIARKELTDALRDSRSIISTLLYCLMGPGIVFMVSTTMNGKDGADSVLVGMMSVFVLVSAFSGGMNVAMDILAGERERQSLLPLLLTAGARRHVILGKWAAICCFSTASLVLNVVAFWLALRAHFPAPANAANSVLLWAAGLIPLALLAAAVELAISTVCRTLKEAHTYLSMLVFVPTTLGMFTVFFPKLAAGWGRIAPLIAQQWQVEHWWRGTGISILPTIASGVVTALLAALSLCVAARLLERDDVVYGG
ncbi:MAG TPA: ABC transporter permease subunit [Bryobacteraceae bacterium]|nr:ABC transporter permease subunit [Bryobacteraceae bacterium]